LEINEQVIAASDYFKPWNNDVLANAKTELIVQDGRAHLNLTDNKYDVIISEPSNPWMAGLSALFTEEFFELTKSRLQKDGLFTQWLHIYQMDWDTVALVGRTFAKVYPSSALVMVEAAEDCRDLLLVGFKGEQGLRLENAEQNFAYASKSRNIDLRDSKVFYRLVVSEDLASLFGDGPLNTDGKPLLELKAPKLMYENPRSTLEIARRISTEGRLGPATAEIKRQLESDARPSSPGHEIGVTKNQKGRLRTSIWLRSTKRKAMPREPFGSTSKRFS
jgi:spermidine synthase